MSTKVFLSIMAIVLAIAGYIAYEKYLDEEDMEPLMNAGISFICQDGSYFSAELNEDSSRLNVVVDGVIARSLTRAPGDNALYEYADGEYVYLFAGEEARVTDVRSGTQTVCGQPFDPNNAPYNFGDLGEGAGGERPDLSLAVSENILGRWQSADDQKFVREFRGNSLAIDTYEGASATEGTWQVFTADSNVMTPFTLEPDTAYLEMRMGGSQDEVLYFKVTKVTPEELELIYMGRGGVLRFTYLGPTE